MITYEPSTNGQPGVVVYLEGKRVGVIRNISAIIDEDRWQYQPAGTRNAGDTYPTVEACKASLESDSDPVFDKAQKMHQAFSTLVNEFAREGQTEKAEQVTKIALQVPDDSMARLYDILKAV